MHSVDPLAIWYLAIFGVFVPFVVIRGQMRARSVFAIPPLKKLSVQIVGMEMLFLVVALVAARNREIEVFSAGTLPARAVVLAGVLIAYGLGTLPARWKLLTEEEKRRSLAARPQSAGELVPWFAVSLAAGVVEEIVYRGVMMAFVLPMAGSWLAAVAICVVLFTLGHANQPWRMVVIALVPMSVGLHYLVLWSGSLYPAMATHFLYDFSAGFLFIRLACERRSAAAGVAAGD